VRVDVPVEVGCVEDRQNNGLARGGGGGRGDEQTRGESEQNEDERGPGSNGGVLSEPGK